MGEPSKSDKYTKAVNRATGTVDETNGSNAPAIPVRGQHSLISNVDQATIDAMMNSGELEFAPQVLSLEEGQMVAGILEGNGPMAEITDPVEKTMKEVPTWIIATSDGSARVSILSSAQLERKLPPFIGGPVKIVRGKDIKTSTGRKVTDYLVAGPKLADGKRRDFTIPQMRVIEAHAQPALPAAVVNAAMANGAVNQEDVA